MKVLFKIESALKQSTHHGKLLPTCRMYPRGGFLQCIKAFQGRSPPICRLHPRAHFLWYIISKVGLSYEASLLQGLFKEWNNPPPYWLLWMVYAPCHSQRIGLRSVLINCRREIHTDNVPFKYTRIVLECLHSWANALLPGHYTWTWSCLRLVWGCHAILPQHCAVHLRCLLCSWGIGYQVHNKRHCGLGDLIVANTQNKQTIRVVWLCKFLKNHQFQLLKYFKIREPLIPIPCNKLRIKKLPIVVISKNLNKL
jgi:hypothetical protein